MWYISCIYWLILTVVAYASNFNAGKRAVNLDNLIHELPQIKHIWKQFGKRVGIKQEVLDECAKTKSPEVAMLEYWLKATKPTWKDVTTTLRVINHPQLAQGIETRHKIGK